MIEINGSIGEGGGQVLRSSLTLSVIYKEAFHIYNIRAGRKNPGLRPQHLKAVEAAALISDAQVDGAEIGSQELVFNPKKIKPGKYTIDIGTAGSAPLVLQTIFVPLSISGGSSRVSITGGTHVPWSPCYHYLEMQWMPFMERMGFEARLSLELAGYYPKGGGQMLVDIYPVKEIVPFSILSRGELEQIRGYSGVSNLPRKIAERQRNRVLHRIGREYPLNDLRIRNLASRFQGTILLLLAEFENSRACYFGLGAIGKPAEKVADEAINAFCGFMGTNGVIDEYLADQLLVPLIFANGASTFRVPRITKHLITNADVIRHFSQVTISIQGELGDPGTVKVGN